MRVQFIGVLIALGLFAVPPGEAKAPLKGVFSVNARLTKIPGKFPPDDLYDYAYVMRYQVVGGERDKQMLLVAHYKPKRPRDKISDAMKPYVAGSLKEFKEGDLHTLKLVPFNRRQFKVALQDEFFAADRKSPRYFCLQADPTKGK